MRFEGKLTRRSASDQLEPESLIKINQNQWST